MSKRIRFLIDAFNSGLHEGTGIATYARVLSRTVAELGHNVALLTDSPMQGSTVDLPVSIRVFDHPQAPHPPLAHASSRPRYPWWVKNRFFSCRRFYDVILKPRQRRASPDQPRPWEVVGQTVPDLASIYVEPLRSRLGYFDDIVNAPDIFRKSVDYFATHGRFLVLKNPSSIDIAHFTSLFPIRVANAKNIITLHDLIPLKLPYMTLDNKELYLRMAKAWAAQADLIITVSETSRKDIIDTLGLPSNKVVNTYQTAMLPQAVLARKRDEVEHALRSTFGLEYRKYFFMLGTIDPRKNIPRTIEAHLGAATSMPLVVCGPRNQLSTAELWGEPHRSHTRPILFGPGWGGDRKVVVFSYLPVDMVWLLIQGARAVVMPSHYEGFGLPALESLILGTPVIASRGGALAEVCGASALYVDPNDTYSIRAAIERSSQLSAQELSNLSETATQRAAEFSPTKYKSSLRECYERLM